MRSSLIHSLCPCLVLGLCTLLHGSALANMCPGTLDIELPKSQEAPAGWDQVRPNLKPPLTISGIRLYDGPPDSAPEIRPKVRQPNYVRWEFRIASKQGPVGANMPVVGSDNDVTTAPVEPAPVRPLWIKCSYGDPAMTLTRPLPADFSACTLKCGQGCQLWCR